MLKLSDAQWNLIEGHLINTSRKPGRNRKYPVRDIVDALLYRRDNKCFYSELPIDYIDPDVACHYLCKWRREGKWTIVEKILDDYRNDSRV